MTAKPYRSPGLQQPTQHFLAAGQFLPPLMPEAGTMLA